jgi:hypothetical protein
MRKKPTKKITTTILFYMADYPQLDTNVAHNIDELYKGSYVILNAEDAKKGEAASLFGAEIDVVIEKYDYEKIMNDFRLNKTPIIRKCDSGYSLFCGGSILVISDHDMDKYRSCEIQPFTVYKKSVYRNIENKNGLAVFLCGSYLTERGLIPSSGEGLRLSYSQVDVIDNMIKGFNMMSLYNMQEPNLFACITQ